MLLLRVTLVQIVHKVIQVFILFFLLLRNVNWYILALARFTWLAKSPEHPVLLLNILRLTTFFFLTLQLGFGLLHGLWLRVHETCSNIFACCSLCTLTTPQEPLIYLLILAHHDLLLLLLLNELHDPWHKILMGHQEIVLRHYRLVRVILCFVVLDVITILVLWEREGTSTALKRELELGLRLFNLRGHVTHFGWYLRWQVWRRWDVTLLNQELLLFVLHILDVSHYAKAFHICSEI